MFGYFETALLWCPSLETSFPLNSPRPGLFLLCWRFPTFFLRLSFKVLCHSSETTTCNSKLVLNNWYILAGKVKQMYERFSQAQCENVHYTKKLHAIFPCDNYAHRVCCKLFVAMCSILVHIFSPTFAEMLIHVSASHISHSDLVIYVSEAE